MAVILCLRLKYVMQKIVLNMVAHGGTLVEQMLLQEPEPGLLIAVVTAQSVMAGKRNGALTQAGQLFKIAEIGNHVAKEFQVAKQTQLVFLKTP
jgi:hypothetical protein